jgi:hypothetical protein
MIDLLLLAMLAQAKPAYEPPWETWYHQGVGCAASAMAAKGRDPSGDKVGEIWAWGMILAEAGRKAGRSKEQVDSGDVETAFPFYQRMKAMKPKAFAAHRAYCRAVLDADRP